MPTSDMLRDVLVAAFLVGLNVSVNARAEQAPSWLDEIATIDAQTQLLKKRDELRRELEKSTAGSIAALPQVVSIMVLAGVPQAQLHYPSGRLGHATIGSLVAPSVRILAITDHGVEVEITRGRNKHQTLLEFATLEARFPNAASPSGVQPVRDEQVPSALLPEPPRVNANAPLPPGMLAGAREAQAR